MSDRVLRMDELTPEQRRLVTALIEANQSAQRAPTVAPKEVADMRHEIVKVTPEVAAEWLARPSTRQRTMSRVIVFNYGRAMVEGRWHEPSTDPIAFTPSGELLNGQHRLTAVVRNGVTLDMLVAYDVPEALFDVIDTGRKRTASQFVRAPHATALASAARLILWYDTRRLADPKHPTPPTGSAAMSFDNDELLSVIEGDLAPILAESVRDASRAVRWCGIPPSVHATVLTIARRDGGDPALIDGWLYGLIEGVGLGMDDPRRRLRQRLTDQSTSSHLRRSIPAVWMLTVRAFNAYMQGRPVKVLKYEADDAAPAIDLDGKTGHRENVSRGRVTTPASGVTKMAASGK